MGHHTCSPSAEDGGEMEDGPMAAGFGDGKCESDCELMHREVSAGLDNSASLLWFQEIYVITGWKAP